VCVCVCNMSSKGHKVCMCVKDVNDECASQVKECEGHTLADQRRNTKKLTKLPWRQFTEHLACTRTKEWRSGAEFGFLRVEVRRVCRLSPLPALPVTTTAWAWMAAARGLQSCAGVWAWCCGGIAEC